MARRLPPLNALRAFEVAARHNSFTGAATEMRVSHAAVSRHVRSLEARLGVTLFRRAKRGVELTEDGVRYLKAVSVAFESIAEAT
jgi:LysR family glycine cleavage system transcriptional activator